MTIQEYTQKIEHLRWLIESKKEKILALEAIATNTTASLTGMPHNPSPTQSRMADAILRKIELENSIKEDESAMQALREQMASAIELVPSPKHQAVLFKRYVRGMTIEEIADDIGYCSRTAQRFLRTATSTLEKILAND